MRRTWWLEAMIDAAPNLSLLEVEGDAAFLYTWPQRTRRPRQFERASIRWWRCTGPSTRASNNITALNTCSCEGCRQAGCLRVKFVAHLGRRRGPTGEALREIGGFRLILVHRMLKNAVPIPEYLLLSEAVFGCVDDRVRSRGQALAQELEGLGVVPTYFMDVTEIAGDASPDPEVTELGRFRENFGVVFRSLPYFLGLKRPRYALRLTSQAVP
jgi:hypothetical protein